MKSHFIRLPASFVALAFLWIVVFSSLTFAEDITVLNSDATGLSLTYRIEDVSWEDFEADGAIYHTPRVQGCGNASPVGAPALPVRVIWLAIPPDAVPVIHSFTTYGVTSEKGTPAPVESISAAPDGSVQYHYNEDPAFYSSVNPYPSNWVEIDGPENYRDIYVMRLLIYPFRYPSADGGISGLDSIKVDVEFQGTTGPTGGYSRPVEDEFYQGFIANWQGVTRTWKRPPARHISIDDPWPSGDLYKIKINASGIYRLTYNDLTNAGIDLSGVDPHTFRIFNNGGRVLPKNLGALSESIHRSKCLLVKYQTVRS